VSHSTNNYYDSLFRVFILLLGFFSPFLLSAGIVVIDDSGQPVKLKRPAQRIISLTPHITELLFAAGAGSQVVGVVDFSDYPEAAKTITRIGGHQSLDYEKMIALQPDLVIAWQSGSPAVMLGKLKKMGIPVFVTDAHSLDDIPDILNRIAILAGTPIQASQVAVSYERKLLALRQKYHGKKRIRVFYQIWQQPLMTINASHLINQVLSLCGGVNIFSDMTMLSGTVGMEDVLIRNPDVVLINANDGRFEHWSKEWLQWKQLKAVQDKHVFQVNPDTMTRQSPRILQGAEEVCAILDSMR